MHELSIVQNIINIVEREIASFGNVRVERIRLRVGVLSCIVPDILTFTFDACSKGSRIEGAKLEIELVPFKIMCISCNKQFTRHEPFLSCPNCGGSNIKITSGRELEIESIEIEDEI